MFSVTSVLWFCLYVIKHKTNWEGLFVFQKQMLLNYFLFLANTSWPLFNSSKYYSFMFNKTHLFLFFFSSLSDLNETFSEDNADTVGQIVNYIMKNEGKLNECVDKDEITHLLHWKVIWEDWQTLVKISPGYKAFQNWWCLCGIFLTEGNMRCNQSVSLILMQIKLWQSMNNPQLTSEQYNIMMSPKTTDSLSHSFSTGWFKHLH